MCFIGFWRRARDSNPRSRFDGLHDFQARIEAADGYEMITDAFYDTGAVEDELYTKCQRVGLFRIAEDETENRRAFDALLCLTNYVNPCFLSLKGSETVLRGDTVTVTKNGRTARYDCGD